MEQKLQDARSARVALSTKMKSIPGPGARASQPGMGKIRSTNFIQRDANVGRVLCRVARYLFRNLLRACLARINEYNGAFPDCFCHEFPL